MHKENLKEDSLGSVASSADADMDDRIEDPIQGFENLSMSDVQANMMSEYESLESGHNTEMLNFDNAFNAYSRKQYPEWTAGTTQKTVNPIIFEKTEWISAAVLKTLKDSKSPFDVVAMGENNRLVAEMCKQLIDDQIGKRAVKHVPLADIIKNMFLGGNSYAKCGWEEGRMPNSESFTFTPVSNAEIRYDSSYTDFYKSPVVTHTYASRRSDILRMAKSDEDWMMHELKAVLSNVGSNNKSNFASSSGRRVDDSALKDDPGSNSNDSATRQDTASSYYTVIEHWTEYDLDGDGFLEPCIAITINGKMVRLSKNDMPDGRHPFVYCQNGRVPLQSLGRTIEDSLGRVQRDLTVLDNMFINNVVGQDNSPIMFNTRFVSPAAAKAYQRGIPNTIIPTTNARDSFTRAEVGTVSPDAYNYRQNLINSGDGITGFTKSLNLDVEMLKGTANNGNIVNNTGQSRIWEITKRMIETMYLELGYKCIAYNAAFLSDEQFKMRFGDSFADLAELNGISNFGDVMENASYQITLDIALASDDQEKLANIFSYAQFFGAQAQEDPQIKKAMSQMSYEAAKLMGLDNTAALLKESNEFIGENGLSVPEDSVTGSEFEGDGSGIGDALGFDDESSEAGVPGLGGLEGGGSEGLDAGQEIQGLGGLI